MTWIIPSCSARSKPSCFGPPVSVNTTVTVLVIIFSSTTFFVLSVFEGFTDFSSSKLSRRSPLPPPPPSLIEVSIAGLPAEESIEPTGLRR